MKREWRVGRHESGTKLLSFLRDKLGKDFSTRRIKRLIDDNGCMVNERVLRVSTRSLSEGDHVVLLITENERDTPKLEILYEDQYFVAYNKPAHLASEKIPGPHLVHRLDKGTSGVILMAKDRETLSSFIELFRAEQLDKCYLALCDGHLEPSEGQVNQALRRTDNAHKPMQPSPKGQPASTFYKRVKRFPRKASLVQCRPKTGRTHQLRVHMSLLGHPILGDTRYADRYQTSYRPGRLLLHAKSLSFPHPVTEEPVTITAPEPSEFKAAYESLSR